MTAFSGWPPAALAFFAGLAADNSKAYWQAHRQVYEETVRAPLENLLETLEGEFGPAKIYRPYRDVRFAADKSPYHTHIAAVAGPGPAVSYVALTLDALIVGAGIYEPSSTELTRLRTAIAGDQHGPELERIVTGLEQAGFVLSGDAVKTAPRGFDPTHPRIRLLRQRALVLARSWPPKPWLHTPKVADRVAESWRAGRPFNDWINDRLLHQP